MNTFILNETYTIDYAIDVYESLCWSDRYNNVGQFEIKTLATMTTLSYVRKGAYLAIQESDRVMIIEKIVFVSDAESGDTLTASGRSLESILDRRVVANSIILDGPFQECVLRLMNENIINPADASRTYPIITFRWNDDPRLAEIQYYGEFFGETLLDVIVDMCQAYNIGFRMLPNYDNGGFFFELYMGHDRSYNQTELPPVVFSPEYENLINSSWVQSDESLKNFIYVNNDTDNIKLEVYNGALPTGRNRRELFLSSSVTADKPNKDDFGPAESYLLIEDEGHGHWETNFDEAGYQKAVEAQRQKARDEIEAAGGTEADIDWPPAGREGQSYEDYLASHVSRSKYASSHFVADAGWADSIEEAEAMIEEKYQAAVTDAIEHAKSEMYTEGILQLYQSRTVSTFDGNIVNYFQFIAGVDYQLGDVVQMVNGLFVNVATRFTEITYCFDSSGVAAIPTFTTDEEMEVKEEL